MGEWIFSLTPIAITHIAFDDSVLVRLALTFNPYFNIVDIWLRSENIRRSSLLNIPTPPSSRELDRNSALAARTIEIHSNYRELLNFNIFFPKLP